MRLIVDVLHYVDVVYTSRGTELIEGFTVEYLQLLHDPICSVVLNWDP